MNQGAYARASEAWNPNGPPVELPIYGMPPPTLVSAVNAAILQLEQGAFYASAYLWDGMMRDDRLAATIGVRIDRLIGSPMSVDPSVTEDDFAPAKKSKDQKEAPGEESDEPEEEATENDADDADAALDVHTAAEAAKKLERQIGKIVPSHQLYELMRYGLGLSVGLAQVKTTRSVKSTLPTFEVWNPRNLRFDWMLRQFRLVTENKGEITIEEDDPEWIIYQPFGPHGWLHGALIRACVTPWIMRYWTRVWWARYQEVHGQPMRLGIIPADRQPQAERLFLTQISNLAHEAVVRLPQGLEGNKFDMKLLEATANNWEGFQQLLQHCDDSFAIIFLGQRQSTDGQGGLGSTENAGESTMMRITRKDALVGDVLREQLIKPWAKDNFGEPEYAPVLRWETEPPEDEAKAADTDQKVGAALMAFKNAGAPINVREYLTERGYPLLSVEDEQAEKDAAMEHAVKTAQALGGSDGPPKPGDKNPAPFQKGAPDDK